MTVFSLTILNLSKCIYVLHKLVTVGKKITILTYIKLCFSTGNGALIYQILADYPLFYESFRLFPPPLTASLSSLPPVTSCSFNLFSSFFPSTFPYPTSTSPFRFTQITPFLLHLPRLFLPLSTLPHLPPLNSCYLLPYTFHPPAETVLQEFPHNLNAILGYWNYF